jgi:hypothetical protein
MTGKWVDTHVDTDNGQAVSTKWLENGPALKDASSDKPLLDIGGELSLDLSEWMELTVGIDFSSDLYNEEVTTGVAGMNINFQKCASGKPDNCPRNRTWRRCLNRGSDRCRENDTFASDLSASRSFRTHFSSHLNQN